jgi:RNA polymerase sigma-70 factor (ECF subfamily)
MHDYQSLPDQKLVELLKLNDKLSYEEIYHRYKGLLYIHAYKKLGNQDDADDVVHDLFAAIWDKRMELAITGHLSGYLYAAIRNRVFKSISKKTNATAYFESIAHSMDKEHCITDHLVRENQLKALIEKEIAALTPKMRQVFEMSRIANLSQKEIAGELNIAEETVKKHIHHALRILRVRLGLVIYLLYVMTR